MKARATLVAAFALSLSMIAHAAAQESGGQGGGKKRVRPVHDPMCLNQTPGCKPRTIPEKVRKERPTKQQFMRSAS